MGNLIFPFVVHSQVMIIIDFTYENCIEVTFSTEEYKKVVHLHWSQIL